MTSLSIAQVEGPPALLLILVTLVAALWVFRDYWWRFGRKTDSHFIELPDPFIAEVLLKNTIIAHLTERKPVDMFWHSYCIIPLSAEGASLIADDELWDSCQFYFRDPKTGKECKRGFVGDVRPFVRNGNIMLRGLYFGPPETVSTSEKNK